MDSDHGFVSWIRIIGLSARILGSDPGFVSRVRIMDSYHGCDRILGSDRIMGSYMYPTSIEIHTLN